MMEMSFDTIKQLLPYIGYPGLGVSNADSGLLKQLKFLVMSKFHSKSWGYKKTKRMLLLKDKVTVKLLSCMLPKAPPLQEREEEDVVMLSIEDDKEESDDIDEEDEGNGNEEPTCLR
ncbi:hypothetical protein E3N88_24900 [Mikania micrantha]|uniref:Uncharacterized protein n=1 Tax=Mikania micrantha TaxID=192012 RepID=A0A5N6N449_9ASTR|nr:hypothetical protein E3N88_24900 [Mikania micrantha]